MSLCLVLVRLILGRIRQRCHCSRHHTTGCQCVGDIWNPYLELVPRRGRSREVQDAMTDLAAKARNPTVRNEIPGSNGAAPQYAERGFGISRDVTSRAAMKEQKTPLIHTKHEEITDAFSYKMAQHASTSKIQDFGGNLRNLKSSFQELRKSNLLLSRDEFQTVRQASLARGHFAKQSLSRY